MPEPDTKPAGDDVGDRVPDGHSGGGAGVGFEKMG